MRTTNTKSKLTSLRDLAQALEKSVSTIHTWRKHDGWRWGDAPWLAKIVPEVREWAAATFKGRTDPAIQQARAELLTEQLTLLRLENGLAAGLFLPLERVKSAWIGGVVNLRTGLMSLPHISTIEGANEGDCRTAIVGRLHTLLQDYTRAAEEIKTLDSKVILEDPELAHLRRHRPAGSPTHRRSAQVQGHEDQTQGDRAEGKVHPAK